MSNKQNPKLVPKIRFPEFQETGSWTTEKLGSVASISTEKVGINICVPMSITSGVGLVSQEEKFGRVIAGDSYKNYLLLKSNDFAYNKSSTKEYPEGFLTLYSGSELAAVPNSIFTCFRVKGESPDPRFLNYQFSDNLHGRWLRNFIQVGARANGALSINDGDLMALPVPMPSGITAVIEQQKIADCLSSLDELIASQARKVEALKTHKKGLMQQLFPREGETQPRLRFLSEGDWVEMDLPQVAFFQEGPGIMAVDFQSEGIPLVRLAGVSRSTVTLDGCNYLDPTKVQKKWAHFCLAEGDLLISTSATFGLTSTVTEVAAGAIFYTGLIRFRPSSNLLDRGYLKIYLGSPHFERQAMSAAVGGGIKHFGPSHLKQMDIPLPPLVEQQLIADCFTSLDAHINGATQELDTLNTHKKGLMQQLFPSLEAVEA
jgi:type I restriction enzyme, S subunit